MMERMEQDSLSKRKNLIPQLYREAIRFSQVDQPGCSMRSVGGQLICTSRFRR